MLDNIRKRVSDRDPNVARGIGPGRLSYLCGFVCGACLESAQRGLRLVSCVSPERSEGLGPFGAWWLSLVLLIGLPACGPMPADSAASLESRTGASKPSPSHSVAQTSSSSMTEGSQKGSLESAVSPADSGNDANSEYDNWSVGEETAQLENETEQEQNSSERTAR